MQHGRLTRSTLNHDHRRLVCDTPVAGRHLQAPFGALRPSGSDVEHVVGSPVGMAERQRIRPHDARGGRIPAVERAGAGSVDDAARNLIHQRRLLVVFVAGVRSRRGHSAEARGAQPQQPLKQAGEDEANAAAAASGHSTGGAGDQRHRSFDQGRRRAREGVEVAEGGGYRDFSLKS
jgi:hypothetical protein